MGIDLTDPEIDSGGKYINAEGWMTLRVQSYKEGRSEKKNSPFVEYVFSDEETGKITKKRFFTQKSALWVFKGFVIACGLEKSLKDIDFEEPVGSELDVFMVRDGKYVQPDTEFAPAGSQTGVQHREPAQRAATNSSDVLPEDDIPF
jgi:hypothetical protein